MGKPNYPSPCLRCEKEAKCSSCGKWINCRDWNTWWRWWWNYFRRACKKRKDTENKRRNKFLYEHPDVIRRYLADGPCKGCKAESVCDTPCPAYLRWWDARMQISRKDVGA